MIDKIADNEVKEVKSSVVENYRNIKPESRMSAEEAKDYWYSEFKNAANAAKTELADREDMHKSDVNSERNKNEPEKSGDANKETKSGEIKDSELKETWEEYIADMKDKSEYPDTIPDKPFEAIDLKKIEAEENAEMRDAFDLKKTQLKQEWEKVNGRPWPKYEEDVWYSSGNKSIWIREAGDDYDAHHIHPLGMGGKNEASNITPLHVNVHFDKQGLHAPDSPYGRLEQKLGGIE